MKITILALGSRGDVQPYAALALGLKLRGHAVTLAASENFKEFVEGFGLAYAPILGDSRKIMADATVTSAIQAGDNYGFFKATMAAVQPIMDSHLDSMRTACEGADLVISSPVTEFSAAVAAEACGAKFALSYLLPMGPSSSFAPVLGGISSLVLPPLNSLAH